MCRCTGKCELVRGGTEVILKTEQQEASGSRDVVWVNEKMKGREGTRRLKRVGCGCKPVKAHSRRNRRTAFTELDPSALWLSCG